MATKGMTVQASVLFNGTQAMKELEQLKKRAEALDAQMSALRQSLGEGYAENKGYKELVKQFGTVNSLVSAGTEKINFYAQAMNDMTGMTVRQLQASATQAKNFQRSFSDNSSQEEVSRTANLLDQITTRIKNLRSGFTDTMQAAQNATGMTVVQLQHLQSALVEEQKLVATDEQSWTRYQSAIDKVKNSITAYAEQSQKAKAESIIDDVQSGNFTGTIAQTREAVQLLEKYRSLLDIKDVQGIVATDDAIAKLNKSLADSNNQWANYNEALKAAMEVRDGTFAGTYKDLEKIRKSLVEYKAQLKTSDTNGLIEVNKALQQIDIAQNRAKNGIVDINDVITNINTTPIDQLQLAAKQLEERLNGATRGTREFVQASADLRQIRAQIQATNRLWENHENVITRTAKRLASYVLAYAGFNEVVGQIKQAVTSNLELSDSLADIQKTTGLSEEAISNLSRSIDEIDTRTGQQQLHELATVAGQIGLRSQEDVLGFVKASNMITVSLNELGSEGTASLMKLAQLTGDVQNMGVEKSLLAIGSSINELSASSSATAGPIVDLMNRLGGIATQSHISTSELAAIGATADALGQSMEVTGTSMNKFIATLLSSSDQVAYAVNMDAKALRDMLESGKTMDAIIAVMQKMNEMGGIQALAPIMGDLGSEGARMTAVLSALSKNVGFLKSQVDLSREAFAEATSIQNEYNVKNENAIAIFQRLGNTIKEAFVNSGMVNVLKQIALAMMDFFKWISSNTAGARAFLAVIVSVVSGLSAYKASLIAVSIANSNFGKVIKATALGLKASVVAVTQYIGSLLGLTTATNAANTATVNFGKAWKALKSINPAGWIGIIIGALGGLAYWLKQTSNAVAEVTKLQGEYNTKLQEEQANINALFSSASKDNISREEKSKLIARINNQYGAYLGYLLEETAGTEKLAAAQELVTAKMKERMALQLQDSMTKDVSDRYASQLNKANAEMLNVFSRTEEISSSMAQDALQVVASVVSENLSKSTGEIFSAVTEELDEKFNTTFRFVDHEDYRNLSEYLRKFIQAKKDYQAEVNTITKFANSEVETANKEVVESSEKSLQILINEYNEIAKETVDKSDQQALIEHYDKLINKEKEIATVGADQMKRVSGQQKEFLENTLKAYDVEIAKVKEYKKTVDTWGKNLNLQGWKESLDNLSTASVESLVKVYKELQDAPKLISDVAKYNKMFGTSFTSLGQVMEDTKDKAKQIKDQLASMGRNTAGNFLWGGNGGNRSAIAEAKREYEAALSALEAYYNTRQTMIRENAMQENQTEEELQRNLDALEEEHLNARIALRKKILSKQDTSFETNYTQVATSDFFKDIDLNKLSDQLGKFGKQLTQGVERQMTEDEVKILTKAWKIHTEISKILLTNNFSKQVNKQMQDSFERTGLFWGEETNRTQQAADSRMAILSEYAKDAYRLDSENLRDRMELDETFGYTVQNMNEEQYAAFLLLLQQYHDKTVEADKKNVALRKRIIEQQWQEEGYETGYKAASSTINNASGNLEMMQSAGAIANEQQYFDSVQELTLQRVALEQWKYEQMRDLYEKNNATDEMYKQLELEHLQSQAEAQKTLLENYIARYQQMAEVTTGYGEIIGDGFGRMIAGEEDAGKQLIKNLLTETINMASEFAKRLILQQTFGTAMQQIKNTQNAQQIASAYTTAMQEIGIEASKMTAIEAIAAGKITAESMAQPDSILTFGASGAARAALIIGLVTAATSAALALVNSLFPSSSDTASASSKRKLTTSMLTYAEGDYPVLGNDGQIYNARYQKDLKTGVYGGGAHFGIFSEKKPEMIVDGNTTEKLIVNYPHIYDAITTIAKHGRLKNAAMPTFAGGDYPAGMKNITSQTGVSGSTGDGNSTMEQMQRSIASMNATISALNATLSKGIGATIDPYANYKAEEKANRFMTKRGMKKGTAT